MKKEEIEEVEKLFDKYSDRDYHSPYEVGIKKSKSYSHRGNYEFYIIIFDDDSVYQLDNDGQKFGIELKSIESLIVRFESFTGENITNIKFREDENPCEIIGHDWRYNFISMSSKRICAVCRAREIFDTNRLDWLDVPFQDSRSEEELINSWFK